MSFLKFIESQGVKILIWKITEDLSFFEKQILGQLSTDEIQKYKTFNSIKRKKEWLAVRLLVKLNFGIYETIFYDQFGKPFLKGTKKISISHSFPYVGVSFSEDEHSIDIQVKTEKAKKISQRFLNNYEFEFSEIADFSALWCIKEAAYKFYSKKNLAFKKIFIKKFQNNKVQVEIENYGFLQIFVEKIEDFYLCLAKNYEKFQSY